MKFKWYVLRKEGIEPTWKGSLKIWVVIAVACFLMSLTEIGKPSIPFMVIVVTIMPISYILYLLLFFFAEVSPAVNKHVADKKLKKKYPHIHSRFNQVS